MLNLIRSELYKLVRSKYFWLCELLVVFLVVLAYFVLTYAISMNISEQVPDASIELQATISSTIGFIDTLISGDIMSVFISIMMCLLVVNEFRLGTIKNMLNTKRRHTVYLSKLLTGLVMSFIFISTVLISCLLIGAVFIGDAGAIITNLPFYASFLLIQTLFAFTLSCIIIMISFIIRNIAAALPICILLQSVLTLIFMILGFFNDIFTVINSYMPFTLAVTYTSPEAFAAGNIPLAIIISAAIIAVTSTAGILCFRRADL